jgi:hypothetical protein
MFINMIKSDTSGAAIPARERQSRDALERDGNILLGIPTSHLIAVFLEKGYSVAQATEMAADMLAVQQSRQIDDLVRDWQNRNAGTAR